MLNESCPLRGAVGSYPPGILDLPRQTIEHAIVTCVMEVPSLRRCTCLAPSDFAILEYRDAFRAATADALLPDDEDIPAASVAFHAYVAALRRFSC